MKPNYNISHTHYQTIKTDLCVPDYRISSIALVYGNTIEIEFTSHTLFCELWDPGFIASVRSSWVLSTVQLSTANPPICYIESVRVGKNVELSKP